MSEITFEKVLRASRAYGLMHNDFSSGLGHAYMVVSPDDEIVDEFFTLVAASVYCQNGNACLECSECRKVLHNNHPDIYNVFPTKDKIKVDDIEQMLDTVSVKPLSGHKIYFIHRADQMNAQAQNKLLKTLEEPPKDVTIFLGIANEASVLDTIKSRARTIAIDVFDEDVVYNALISLGIDESTCAIAAACSEGQLGKARKIALSPKYADLYKCAIYVLTNLARSSDVVRVDGIVTSESDLNGLLDVLCIILRDMLVCKQNQNLMLSKHLSSDIINLSGRYSERALAEILFKINVARRKLSLNVNVTATVDDLLFSMLEAKHKWQ